MSVPLSLAYPNLVTLNNVALTDESRGPVQVERDDRSVVVQLASGRERKFIKGGIKRRFQMDWELCPQDATFAIDGNGGRDEIKALIELTIVEFPLVLKYDNLMVETYTVYVDSYSESVVNRRPKEFRYKINFSLKEV